MQSLSSIEEEERLAFFNSKERADMVRLIVYSMGHKIDNKDVERFIKTLTTYEWNLPTDKDVEINIVKLLEIIGYRPFYFPITEKLYNMFNGIRKYINTRITLYLCNLSVYKFAIDLGYVNDFFIKVIYDNDNLDQNYLLGIKLGAGGIGILYTKELEKYHYIKKVMITF
jgi:hypothetical protein